MAVRADCPRPLHRRADVRSFQEGVGRRLHLRGRRKRDRAALMIDLAGERRWPCARPRAQGEVRPRENGALRRSLRTAAVMLRAPALRGGSLRWRETLVSKIAAPATLPPRRPANGAGRRTNRRFRAAGSIPG